MKIGIKLSLKWTWTWTSSGIQILLEFPFGLFYFNLRVVVERDLASSNNGVLSLLSFRRKFESSINTILNQAYYYCRRIGVSYVNTSGSALRML